MILFLVACNPHLSGAAPDASPLDLSHRAYVVSAESNEMFVFDHDTLEVVGSVDTTVRSGAINGNHMAMVSADGAKVYTTAADQGTLVVIDAATLEVTEKVAIGGHATHMALRDGTAELWLMAEDANAVVVFDTDTDSVVRTITSDTMFVPHFARFSGDRAYVPSIGGNQVSVVDLATYEVIDAIVPDGLAEGACEGDPCGFADAQISPSGLLFASHFSTGRVVVFDTVAQELVASGEVGGMPWSAFVDPFDEDGDFAFVPSWTTATVSRVDRSGVASSWLAGGDEVYGVNFSPTAPGEAFVLNRSQDNVRVLDRDSGEVLDTLDVGGRTETGTTTPEGRLLLPISSAGAVLVYDTATHEELARFEGVGTYPWSVTTLAGQNYCH
jgi:YVTN family beta-propeller protein